MIDEKLLKSEERAIFNLRSLYRKYGYAPFKMSKFEEYDLYVRNKDFLVSDRVITFNDTNGKLMALKPDVTLSIIKNSDDTPNEKKKVFYNENGYRISKNTHRYKEIMQAGLECIGDLDFYDIYEVISLAAETLAQIEYCESRGMKPSHVDSHMGALYGLNGKLRMLPKTLSICGKKGYPFRMFSKPLASQCPKGTPLWLFNAACRFSGIFGKINNVPMPDYLIFPENIEDGESYEDFKNNFIEYLINIPHGICETYIHPALDTEEMKSITGRWERRYHEYLVMKDPEVHAAFKTHGIRLISYRDLVQLKK